MNEVLVVDNIVPNQPHDRESLYRYLRYTQGVTPHEFRDQVFRRIELYAQTQLFADRVVRVYAEQITQAALVETFAERQYQKIILSGSFNDVDENLPWIENQIAALRLTDGKRSAQVYGKCLGLQIMAKAYGGRVENLLEARQGPQKIITNTGESSIVWANHKQWVSQLPTGAEVLAQDEEGLVPYTVRFPNGDIGYQHHPERLVV